MAYRQFRHAAVVEWTDPQLARTAGHFPLEIQGFVEERIGPFDVRWPEERHDGAVEGGGEVTWAGVGCNQQIEPLHEGFRQTLGGIPAVGIVPSAAYRAQILAAQPSLAPFVNAYPTSSTVSTSDPNQALYTSVVPSPSHENSGVIRIDHRLGVRDSMYGRYNIDDGLATSSLNNAGEAITVGSRVQNFVLEELHTFGPRLLNEIEFGFNSTLLHSS